MLKSKLPRHTRDKGQQALLQGIRKTPSGQPKWLVTIEKGFGILLGLLAIVGFYLSYIVPKVSVGVGDSLESANPLASNFMLSNDGALPVHDILVKCGAIKAKAGSYSIDSGPNNGFVFPDSRAEILSPGHHMTLPCGHAVGFGNPSAITEAEITIIVTYRPGWTPVYHKTERYPMKAEKTRDGRWIWKSLPQ